MLHHSQRPADTSLELLRIHLLPPRLERRDRRKHYNQNCDNDSDGLQAAGEA